MSLGNAFIRSVTKKIREGQTPNVEQIDAYQSEDSQQKEIGNQDVDVTLDQVKPSRVMHSSLVRF